MQNFETRDDPWEGDELRIQFSSAVTATSSVNKVLIIRPVGRVSSLKEKSLAGWLLEVT